MSEPNNIKIKWTSIGDNKEISVKQQFNGKTYAEIKRALKKGEEIADYPLLQKLRNSGKFKFLKEFWVFVPNPDKISENDECVARFAAGSGWACLDCSRDASCSYSSLGVFIVRNLK